MHYAPPFCFTSKVISLPNPLKMDHFVSRKSLTLHGCSEKNQMRVNCPEAAHASYCASKAALIKKNLKIADATEM